MPTIGEEAKIEFDKRLHEKKVKTAIIQWMPRFRPSALMTGSSKLPKRSSPRITEKPEVLSTIYSTSPLSRKCGVRDSAYGSCQ